MEAVDFIDTNLSLLNSNVDFEDIVKAYTNQYPLEDYQIFDEFLYEKFDELITRMNFYGLSELIIPENGNTTLIIEDQADLNVKKYLHRFLTYKSDTGGLGANSDGSAQLFEDISANAVKNFLGEGSQIIMVGEGRVSLTEARLKEITKEIKESKGVYEDLPMRAKDDGVDFIVYKPLDSRNIGNIIILGQACVGKHYTQKKEIKERWKSDYIKFAIRPPTTLLSIVSFLDIKELKGVHSEFGNAVVFDRGRIIKYFSTSDEELNERIISFVENNINEY